MAHNVLVNVKNTVVGGATHQPGDVVKVEETEFASLTTAGRFTDNTLTDQGAIPSTGDSVYAKSTAPTALVAMTSAAAAANPPTKVEYDALRQDVVNTRTYLSAVVAAMTGTGKEF